jgi:hypothetical protein
MAEAGMAGLGRLSLSRRERMILVEPRDAGMALITLRAAEEVRAADFSRYDADLDDEAVAIAAIIIKRKSGAFFHQGSRFSQLRSLPEQLMFSAGSTFMDIGDIPLPATPEARKLGCSCPDFDPQQAVEGESQVPDPGCPVHGLGALNEDLKSNSLP